MVTEKKCALTAYKLLKNKAEYAKALLKDFTPVMTKEEYIRYMDAHNVTESIPMKPVILP